MKLGELKQSLSRFPPDMDNTEVVVQFVDGKGQLDADTMTFVAYANYKEDVAAILLGTWKAADLWYLKDPSQFPPNYKTHTLSQQQKHTDKTNEK